MNKIPAGYRFSFLSHDIRNENEKMIIKEGLNEDEANLFAQLGEYLKGGVGIELEDLAQWRKTKIHNELINIFEAYPMIIEQDKLNSFKNDLGMIMDFISENILSYDHDESINMRFLSSYKIEDIPQDILLNDVTSNFSKKHKM